MKLTWKRVVTWAVEGERRLYEERPRQWRWTTAAVLIMAALAPLLFALAVWPFFSAAMLTALLFRLVVWRRGSDALAATLFLVFSALVAALVVWQTVYYAVVA